MNLDLGILLIIGGVLAAVLFLLFPKSKGPVVSRQSPDWAQLSLAANKTDYGVLLVEPDGAIEWVNPAFTRITGYELPEATGKLLAAVLLGSLHSPKVSQQIKTGFTPRKGFTLE